MSNSNETTKTMNGTEINRTTIVSSSSNSNNHQHNDHFNGHIYSIPSWSSSHFLPSSPSTNIQKQDATTTATMMMINSAMDMSNVATSSFRPYIPNNSFIEWPNTNHTTNTAANSSIINQQKYIQNTSSSSASSVATKRRFCKETMTTANANAPINATDMHNITSSTNNCRKTTTHNVCPSPNKRRKPEEPDEQMVRIPLTSGWKRITHVRLITRTGVRGDVVYYSPDEKKLKSFQEIDRYLLKNANVINTCTGSQQLSRHNFTFSSKFLVGTFVRHLLVDGDSNTRPQELTEQEIINLIRKENPEFKTGEAPKKRSFTSSGINAATAANKHTQSHDRSLISPEAIRMSKVAATTTTNIVPELKNIMQDDSCVCSSSLSLPPSAALAAMASRPKTKSTSTSATTTTITTTRLPPNPSISKSDMYWPTVRNLIFIRHRQIVDSVGEDDSNRITSNSKERWTGEQRIDGASSDHHHHDEAKTIDDLLINEAKSLPDFEPIANTQGNERCAVFGNCLMAVQMISIFAHKFEEFKKFYSLFLNTCEGFSEDDISHNIASAFNDSLYAENDSSVQDLCVELLRLIQQSGHLDECIGDFPINECSLAAILDIVFNLRDCQYVQLSAEVRQKSFFELNATHKSQALRWLCDEFLSTKDFYACIDEHVNSISTARHRLWKIGGQVRKFKGSVSSVHHTISGEETNDEVIEECSTSTHTEDTLLHEQGRLRRQISSGSDMIRILYLGRDRFFRRYWFLYGHRAIYIEASGFSESVNERETSTKTIADLNRLHLIAQTLANSLIDASIEKKVYDDDDDQPLDLSAKGNLRSILETLNRIDEREITMCEQVRSHESNLLESANNEADQSLYLEKLEVKKRMMLSCPIQWSLLRDGDKFNELMSCLCKDGERESRLLKSITKNFSIIHSCLTSKRNSCVAESRLERSKTNECPRTNIDDAYAVKSIEERVKERVKHMIDRLQFNIRCTLTTFRLFGPDANNEQEQFSFQNTLLMLERLVEGRYINEKYRSKLECWREQVGKSKSISHVYLLAWQLENQIISWEKSMTRVKCQICNLDNDDDKLLLCDQCENAYHTFCIRTNHEVTEDDRDEWLCHCCRSFCHPQLAHQTSLLDDDGSVCFVCGSREEDLLMCDHCSKHYHQQCLSYKSSKKLCRVCAACVNLSGGSFNNNNNSCSMTNTSMASTANKRAKKIPVSLSQVEVNQKVKMIVNSLIKHESSRPFRDPVDRILYPDYYQLISNPINLRQIKRSTLANRYSNVCEFAKDIIQMLNNCNIYNEDNSKICEQGRELSLYFRKLLLENINDFIHVSDDPEFNSWLSESNEKD